MNDGYVPDRLERRIRFGCGFLVGAVLGIAGALFHASSLRVPLAAGVATALLAGMLARRYGDRFWHWLRWFV